MRSWQTAELLNHSKCFPVDFEIFAVIMVEMWECFALSPNVWNMTYENTPSYHMAET